MTDPQGSCFGDKPRRRPPRPVTSAYLERAALAYLERYASSADNLARVLRRKVEARCRLRGEDATEFLPRVEPVVARAVTAGLLDDSRYAAGRVATLRRRGGSARLIAAKLGAKGVERATIQAALADDPGDELTAAKALARRRRIGPFRSGERSAFREKDLAVLARAGFAFGIARQVVDAEAEE